jgi:hypothetical protein
MRSRVPHDSEVALTRDAVDGSPCDSPSLGVLLLPLRSHCGQCRLQRSNDASPSSSIVTESFVTRFLVANTFETIQRKILRQANDMELLRRNHEYAKFTALDMRSLSHELVCMRDQRIKRIPMLPRKPCWG